MSSQGQGSSFNEQRNESLVKIYAFNKQASSHHALPMGNVAQQSGQTEKHVVTSATGPKVTITPEDGTNWAKKTITSTSGYKGVAYTNVTAPCENTGLQNNPNLNISGTNSSSLKSSYAV